MKQVITTLLLTTVMASAHAKTTNFADIDKSNYGINNYGQSIFLLMLNSGEIKCSFPTMTDATIAMRTIKNHKGTLTHSYNAGQCIFQISD